MKLKNRLILRDPFIMIELTKIKYTLVSGARIKELRKMMLDPITNQTFEEDGSVTEEVPEQYAETFGEDLSIAIFLESVTNIEDLGLETNIKDLDRTAVLGVKKEIESELSWGDLKKVYNLAQAVLTRDYRLFEEQPFLSEAVEHGLEKPSPAQSNSPELQTIISD